MDSLSSIWVVSSVCLKIAKCPTIHKKLVFYPKLWFYPYVAQYSLSSNSEHRKECIDFTVVLHAFFSNLFLGSRRVPTFTYDTSKNK